MILSFHLKKILNIGQGGMILTNRPHFNEWARPMIYDGRHKDLFNGALATLRSIGIESNFISPIGYMTKKELYEMLPKEVREMVTTCSHPWINDMNDLQECGKCNKCDDLMLVKKACEEW